MRADTEEQRERTERLKGLRVRLGTPEDTPRCGERWEGPEEKGERRDRERRDGKKQRDRPRARLGAGEGVSVRKRREWR